MTQMQTPPETRRESQHVVQPPPVRRSPWPRVGLVALSIASLAFAGVARHWSVDEREAIFTQTRGVAASATVAASSNSSSSLSSMPAFATALLLGGLRGPLVMMLWISSETQKQQHDLEDFDTKVEWIRLLQPEFDTVHLFQIWNKAYNISVQMSSLRNKYIAILDGIDYGLKVDRERPDDVSIITQIGNLYGDKLGTSAEHVYYRARVRLETQTLMRITFPAAREADFRAAATAAGWIEDETPIIQLGKTGIDQVMLERPVADAVSAKFNGPDVHVAPDVWKSADQNSPTWRRVRLDPMLDENGHLLPDLLRPRYRRPSNLAPDADFYDGSAMQALKQYDGFPYGVSTLAVAYNYCKRSQMLLREWDEHHLQSGDTVVDARPALELKNWARDEWERGIRAELKMRGMITPQDVELWTLEPAVSSVPMDSPILNDQTLDEALYSYKLGARLFAQAQSEFVTHCNLYPDTAGVYFVHIDDAISGQHMMKADYDFLLAQTLKGDERTRLLKEAANEYNIAGNQFILTILKYYVADDIAADVFPKDPRTGEQYNRATIGNVDPGLLGQIMVAVKNDVLRRYSDPNTHKYLPVLDQNADDRQEYQEYVNHCAQRIQEIFKAIGQPQ
jgi:hypothetical protein